MPEQPIFSIIIPTFNAANTVKEALQSVIMQSCQNYEIIVIDGGSTDQTIDIISKLELTSKTITIVSEPDKGIYDAMNKGIGMARGSYLYFLGSDDSLFGENVLQAVAGQLNSHPAKVLYGNVKMHGSNQFVLDGTIYGGAFDLRRILVHNIPHQAIFYHRSVFDELGGYNINYRVFADHDFNIKAFAHYQFEYTDLIIANFTVGGMSTTSSDQFDRDRISNIVRYFSESLGKKEFIPLRYYVQQAAFNPNVHVPLHKRFYYALLYTKSKLQSFLN